MAPPSYIGGHCVGCPLVCHIHLHCLPSTYVLCLPLACIYLLNQSYVTITLYSCDMSVSFFLSTRPWCSIASDGSVDDPICGIINETHVGSLKSV
jgi:hypothetical protein